MVPPKAKVTIDSKSYMINRLITK